MNVDSQSVQNVAADVRALRSEARRQLAARQPQAALDCLDRALACDPEDPVTLTERGNVLQDLLRPAEAVLCYDRALQLRPELVSALINRSNALRALQRCEEALSDLDSALRIKPSIPEALNNRGNVLRDLRRLPEAVASFDQALSLRPDFPLALCNRGNALLDLSRPAEALHDFETALQYVPDDPEALFGRGSALLRLRQRLETALEDFDRAAGLGIDRIETLVGKAAALAELQRHGEAAQCLATARAMAPSREYLAGSLLHSLLQTCEWTQLAALTNEVIMRVEQGAKITDPQSLLSLVDSPALQLQCARVFTAQRYPEQPVLGPCPARARADGKIRLAYVSADLREHPVSYLLIGALERHDRTQFEVIGISLGAARGGDFEPRLWRAFDRFIEVSDLSDLQVAELLRQLKVDIAIDLMGHTQDARLGIFAHRAAPVQVSYLGYSGTLGASYIDYLIADDIAIPAEEEPAYSECIVRLPGSFLPNDDQRDVGPIPSRIAAGLPERGFVFCGFNNVYKINPATFDIWMSLLRAVRGSVLWLRDASAEARANLQGEAVRRGIEPERLVFAPHVLDKTHHLARQALADLYLDTVPYNAHSTACDALWAGVPVVTCAGRSFAARVAASALTAAGLPDLIARNLEEYERKALELARDPQRLQRVRSWLAQNRKSSALFDTTSYTQHLEAAYRHMHERAVRGEPPAAFAVPAKLQSSALTRTPSSIAVGSL